MFETYIRTLENSTKKANIGIEYWVISWALAVAFFVGGDVITTYYGVVHDPTLSEAHPVSKNVLSVGGFGLMILFKCIVIALVVILSKQIENDYIGISGPVTLGFMGILITMWNCLMIFFV